MLCVLAGYGIVALASAVAARPRRAAALVAGLAALACAQGLLASVHVDRLLGRTDTRAQALRWIGAHVPGGAPRGRGAVRAGVMARRAERPVYPVERPVPGLREAPARAPTSPATGARGYCWVVVGSLQKDRGLKAGLRSSRNYYRALDAASERTVTFSPYARGADPVEFSYDASFNYHPRAYERPGPGGRDPPPAQLHPGGRLIRRACP